jgi:hypothetical protein
MKSSLRVIMAVSCLVMTTSCFAQTKPSQSLPVQNAPGSGGAAKQAINYVEVIQLDDKTKVFNAKLVDVKAGTVLLEVSGKGTQLQDFQTKSATIAPREQTVAITGPWAETVEIRVNPPVPPGPAGGDLLSLAKQVAHSYEINLEQQMKLKVQPGQLRPGAIDPRVQPGPQSPVANPNVQQGASAPKK